MGFYLRIHSDLPLKEMHDINMCLLLPLQQGFGNIDGEYWLGLENIYWLTNQGNYKLLITMEDWSGRKVFAEYASFRLEPESEYYKLRLGRYNGNAGDSFTWHNGKQFTTLDRDHDVYTGTRSFPLPHSSCPSPTALLLSLFFFLIKRKGKILMVIHTQKKKLHF